MIGMVYPVKIDSWVSLPLVDQVGKGEHVFDTHNAIIMSDYGKTYSVTRGCTISGCIKDIDLA